MGAAPHDGPAEKLRPGLHGRILVRGSKNSTPLDESNSVPAGDDLLSIFYFRNSPQTQFDFS